MGNPLDPFIHQLQHLVFAVFIPLMFLAAVVGLVLRAGTEKLGLAIARFLRGKPNTAKEGRGSAANDEANADTSVADAPCCPKCRRRMVKRTARRGAKSGSVFWGCPAYPDCNGTRRV